MDQEDKELLEELLEKRGSEKKKKTLQNLLNDEKNHNSFFSLNGIYTVLVSIVSVIIMGTIWWVNINFDMDTFNERINENETLLEQQINSKDIEIQEIKTRLNKIKNRINSLNIEFENYVSSQREKKELFNVIDSRTFSGVEAHLESMEEKIMYVQEDSEEYKNKIKDLKFKIRQLEKELEKMEQRIKNNE